MEYDLIIIGGGPAGIAAGVYASRKRLKTLFLTESFGGQSIVSEGIENWIGTVKISGNDLALALKNHLQEYAADIVDIHENERVNTVEQITHSSDKFSKNIPYFSVKTAKNEYKTATVLVATGSYRRKLTQPGADKFENKGITYCASCDGPLFADQDVAVIGGGNAAFESAAQLLAYCKSVTLLNRSNDFRADPVTVKKVLSNPKMRAIMNAELLEIRGDTFANSLVYANKAGSMGESGQTKTSEEKIQLPVTGIFVEIGLVPTTYFVEKLLKLNDYKQIIVDPRNQRTSVTGVWAAGDCTDGLYHQNNIAAGDAIKALENIYTYLHAH
jgi:alkyl hydroperoxide reductase subunit F